MKPIYSPKEAIKRQNYRDKREDVKWDKEIKKDMKMLREKKEKYEE